MLVESAAVYTTITIGVVVTYLMKSEYWDIFSGIWTCTMVRVSTFIVCTE
jgi:hypothetical protein